MRPERLAVGTLCKINVTDDVTWAIVTVVGTWAFTGASGVAGTVETRSRKFGSDPRTDETAKGYLLLPSEGSGFIFAHWADVDCGDLVALT